MVGCENVNTRYLVCSENVKPGDTLYLGCENEECEVFTFSGWYRVFILYSSGVRMECLLETLHTSGVRM